ncbi:hypothetical protein DL93DRAFT_686748 [Clavulina sp. PMI_390]|nr:hypothetical protein DL93DRAFT_686748 [Clavulina sp. PMI_390]
MSRHLRLSARSPAPFHARHACCSYMCFISSGVRRSQVLGSGHAIRARGPELLQAGYRTQQLTTYNVGRALLLSLVLSRVPGLAHKQATCGSLNPSLGIIVCTPSALLKLSRWMRHPDVKDLNPFLRLRPHPSPRRSLCHTVPVGNVSFSFTPSLAEKALQGVSESAPSPPSREQESDTLP